MINKYRVWDKIDNQMILPEEEEKGKTSSHPTMLAMGLHGLIIAVDLDSFKDYEIIGHNVDHNRFPMRYTDLKDRDGKEVVAGDLRLLHGKLYKVVDWGWSFQFERNLVEFGENDRITLDEDSVYESSLVGDIYRNEQLLLSKH